MNFSLNAACYTLTTGVDPAGSGSVTASAANCEGGRLHGRFGGASDGCTEYRLRLPELERGSERDEQPGLGDDGREQERHRKPARRHTARAGRRTDRLG